MSGFIITPEHEPVEPQAGKQLKQITDPDHRFYERSPGVFYPSMTTVMSNGLPKDKYLDDWNRQYGHMAKVMLDNASKEGTLVHDACEQLLRGEQVTYEEFEKRVFFKKLDRPVFLWKMVLKFCFFYTKNVTEVFDIEVRGFTDKFKIAGTRDLRCRLTDGHIWLIDFKTSNYNHADYGIQTMGYKIMCEEAGLEVHKRGILHLKAATRGPAKKAGLIQGKGWKLIEHTDDEHDLKSLQLARATYAHRFPNAKPNIAKYPEALTLEKEYHEEDFQLEEEFATDLE